MRFQLQAPGRFCDIALLLLDFLAKEIKGWTLI